MKIWPVGKIIGKTWPFREIPFTLQVPGLFGLPCRFTMGAQGAEIDHQVCDAHEDALLHVAKPRELVCENTDKDVERCLSLVITGC